MMATLVGCSGVEVGSNSAGERNASCLVGSKEPVEAVRSFLTAVKADDQDMAESHCTLAVRSPLMSGTM